MQRANKDADNIFWNSEVASEPVKRSEVTVDTDLALAELSEDTANSSPEEADCLNRT